MFEPRAPRALPGRRRLVSSIHLFVPTLACADGAPQQQPICTAVCTGEQMPLGGEGECLESRGDMSNTDLGMPLIISSLPSSALALLQPSRITGAFVRPQQPSSEPHGN